MPPLRDVLPDACAVAARNPIEATFHRYVEPYLPYMNDRRRFQMVRSRPLLAGMPPCPEFTYDIFARCMRFAVDSDWRSPLDTARP